MSLPDTIFIFVLALIIFGPKKLPEIGRQLGKLVGEFRRASNEFKFQIEEELRQADLTDKREKQPAIAAPVQDSAAITDTSAAAPVDPAENLPVGQHPNIESVDTTELNEFGVPAFGHSNSDVEHVESETVSETTSEIPSEPNTSETLPTITAAAGSQARTSIPFAPTEAASSAESTVPLDSHSAATEAEITHG